MPVLVLYALCCVAPALTFWLADRLLRHPPRPSGRALRLLRREPDPPVVGPSLERLVDDLRRLERDYRRIERSNLPAKAHRLQAVGLAYDDTLRCCCTALELPMPQASPLRSIDRLQVEADLAQHGLLW
ncbi:hypothetical protein [Segeticoccus rhizosphaerae]|jgi:hypothetical protein|uniref:hypothetical protein n=1 Tax=Segeticoccus rhizosphaerae TaxID=1104777 RepID=UPI0010C089C7|nr:hypothetical protein [Ornithinicoccus soli]